MIKAWHFVSMLFLMLLGACGSAQGNPAKGEELFKQTKIGLGDAPGCSTCHSILPDEVIVGPSLFGVSMRAEDTMKRGDYAGKATTVSDYIEESIRSPNAFVREGFSPDVMYQGFADELTDEQILDLIAFLKTLK